MAAARQKNVLTAGARAPQFRLPRLGGGEVALSDLTAGGPVLLAFFKVSCPVCQMTFPFLERIHVAGTMPVYGISQNNAEDTHDFNRAFRISFPTLLDPEDEFPASNAFGISHVPSLFLVERDRTISWTLDGWSRKDIQSLAAKAGVNPFHPDDQVPEWKSG
jgi:peroxiredoxin